MRARTIRGIAVVSVCVVTIATAFSLWPTSTTDIRTEDRDGDGRPDLWRTYDPQGRLLEEDIDSNFDGRRDIRKYYKGGRLIRQESDRNFDGRVDLVEEFDASTGERARSVVDVDSDGTADLLVLFQNGLPAFSKWAAQATRTYEQPQESQ